MKLYKYKSIDNLWHIMDIVLMSRIYCAHWSELNDPLEGRYTIFLQDENMEPVPNLTDFPAVNSFKDRTKIAALSSDGKNFLMWSHYASGHRGIVIEFDIPDDEEYLHQVNYTPFDAIINNEYVSKMDFKHVFLCKTESWSYEKEYRILRESPFYSLSKAPTRLILGGLIDKTHEDILIRALQDKIDITHAKINRYQGWVEFT